MVRPQSHLSSALYSSLLLSGHHGYPLLNPQPLDEIPAKLREIGTQIGDVGVVTEDGSFEPFFNILHEAGDKIINWLGVPKYFERLVLSHGDVSKSPLYHERGSYISNTTLNVKRLDADVTDATYIALLVLPDGASRWDLRSMTLFRDYAVRHAQNWYKFVNGQLGRSIGNSGLMLITGVTKSTSWAVAIRQNTSGNAPLTLRAVQVAGAEPLCVWECVDQSDWSFFSGPTRRLGEETWKDNQTPFLRGFKVTTRPTPLMEPMKIGVSDGVTEKNFVY
ncbi:hypothetical protein B0H14DRAFT_2363292 [Mycena olivaceomarginata]|nr:hypothetical protein B0H14DRAFT_2363292 [Mycena olivaceomarginata]